MFSMTGPLQVGAAGRRGSQTEADTPHASALDMERERCRCRLRYHLQPYSRWLWVSSRIPESARSRTGPSASGTIEVEILLEQGHALRDLHLAGVYFFHGNEPRPGT